MSFFLLDLRRFESKAKVRRRLVPLLPANTVVHLDGSQTGYEMDIVNTAFLAACRLKQIVVS